MGEQNDGGSTHQERVRSIVTAVSQQYHDVAEEGQVTVTILSCLSIHSCMSRGSKGSWRVRFSGKSVGGDRCFFLQRVGLIDEAVENGSVTHRCAHDICIGCLIRSGKSQSELRHLRCRAPQAP